MQYNRQVQLKVGVPGESGRQWSNPLHISMAVDATDGKQPNRLEAKLYNLNDGSAAFLKRDGLVAQMLAGYDTPELIGAGEVSTVDTSWQGTDRLTVIECGDGKRAYTGRIKKSWGKKVGARKLIGKVAEAMGLDADVSRIGDVQFPRGMAFDGKARDAMDQLTRSVGADWQIERGRLVLLPQDEATTRRSVLLTSDTGLVGVPQRTKDGIKLKMLLNPKIRIRSIVRVESREITGFYMVRSYKHTADTHEDAWYTEAEATRIDGQ